MHRTGVIAVVLALAACLPPAAVAAAEDPPADYNWAFVLARLPKHTRTYTLSGRYQVKVGPDSISGWGGGSLWWPEAGRRDPAFLAVGDWLSSAPSVSTTRTLGGLDITTVPVAFDEYVVGFGGGVPDRGGEVRDKVVSVLVFEVGSRMSQLETRATANGEEIPVEVTYGTGAAQARFGGPDADGAAVGVATTAIGASSVTVSPDAGIVAGITDSSFSAPIGSISWSGPGVSGSISRATVGPEFDWDPISGPPGDWTFSFSGSGPAGGIGWAPIGDELTRLFLNPPLRPVAPIEYAG